MEFGKKFIVSILSLIILMGTLSTVEAKSVYVINDTAGTPAEMRAYKVEDANLVHQTEADYDFVSETWGAVGLAIYDSNYRQFLFATFENENEIELINAKTMQYVDTVEAPQANNLAGIVVDKDRSKVYIIDRGDNHLYVYSWNPITKELTLDLPDPYYVELDDCNEGYGLALDEENDLLYVGDNTTTVKYYDANDPNWSKLGQFTVTDAAIGIAIDVANQYVYTGNGTGGGGNTYLSQYDLLSPTETRVDVTSPVLGIAVDQQTSLVYVTTYGSGSNPQRLIIYDSNLVKQPWESGDIGAPAGVAVAGNVSYKPSLFTLSKIDDVNDGNCVSPGDYITYTITYGPNGFDHNDVVITDYLPVGVEPNNPSDPNYDLDWHTYTWQIGPLGPNAPNDSVTLKVKVNGLAEPLGTLINQCEIESDIACSTAEVNTPVCWWSPDIIYVDVNATGSDTGLSWYNADPNLQRALQKAQAWDPNQIWVAAGTYKPTTEPEDYYTAFELVNGVDIYGGFAGNESAITQRNLMINETILDGNLPPYGVSDVVHANDVNETTTIDGFTIKNAWWAGIKVDNSSLTIEHNKIKENGYGIWCINQSSVSITNCEITDNVGQTDTYVYGAGICCVDSNDMTVTNCIIIGNESKYSGGGIYDYNSLSSAITNCTFSNNRADSGGGLHNRYSSPNITNCIFSGNSAVSYGGGMRNYLSSPTVTNCIFSGNSAGWGGGMQDHNDSSPTLSNCTFSGNFARYGGGMHNEDNSDPNITNCIFWNNTTDYNGHEIYNYGDDTDPKFSYCDIKGIFNTDPEYSGHDSIDGGDNINSDPNFLDVNTPTGSWTANASYDSSTHQSTLTDANASWSVDELACNFIDPNTSQYLQFFIVSNDANTIKVWGDVTSIAHANDTYEIFDYRLSADSNCIDAGDPDGDYDDQADIYGEPREVNGRVDIGADEYYVADWVFCIKNGLGVHVAWFDDSGNVFLKGIFEPNTTPEASANDEFRFQDSNSNDVAIIDANSGNMYIEGLLQAQWQDPNGQNNEFVIEDSNDQPVSYINDSGNVFLKGRLYDDIWP